MSKSEMEVLERYHFWKTIFKTEELNHEEEMLRKPVFSSSVSGCKGCNSCASGSCTSCGGGCSGCKGPP